MKPFTIAKLSCNTFAIEARQFVVQLALEMMKCFCRVVGFVVHAEAQSHVWIFGRGADQDALRAAFGQMQLGFVAAGEKAGRFEHDIHAQILPGQIARIAFLQDPDLVAAHDDVFADRGRSRRRISRGPSPISAGAPG